VALLAEPAALVVGLVTAGVVGRRVLADGAAAASLEARASSSGRVATKAAISERPAGRAAAGAVCAGAVSTRLGEGCDSGSSKAAVELLDIGIALVGAGSV
jgi:hypothetical protein